MCGGPLQPPKRPAVRGAVVSLLTPFGDWRHADFLPTVRDTGGSLRAVLSRGPAALRRDRGASARRWVPSVWTVGLGPIFQRGGPFGVGFAGGAAGGAATSWWPSPLCGRVAGPVFWALRWFFASGFALCGVRAPAVGAGVGGRSSAYRWAGVVPTAGASLNAPHVDRWARWYLAPFRTPRSLRLWRVVLASLGTAPCCTSPLRAYGC